MQSLHSGSSACLKSKAQTLDAKLAFWSFCLPKIQNPNLGCKVGILGLLPAEKNAQALDAKFAFWAFCLPKIQGPNLGCKGCIPGLLRAQNSRPKPWMQSLHSESSACLKFKTQTLDAKFAFWVFCLPKKMPKPWMQSLHSGPSACPKFKAPTLDAKGAFRAFCVPKIQGPNLGCKVCILSLLPA